MNPKRFDLEVLIDDDVKTLSRTDLPDYYLLSFYKRLANREIFWNCDVDTDLVDFSWQILEWNREDRDISIEDRKPIIIYINSDGGCLNSVMNFIDVIKLSKTPVITIAMGKAYSAGGLLLMAGHKRYIFKDTTFLLHDGSTGAFGSVSKVVDSLQFTQKTHKRRKKFILANTKISEDLYDKNYRRDWFMFSDEIIKYGVADKIIIDLSEIL